ncbi:MAG: hypothetical protein R3C05_20080 [Pirellulaceae bacterium]
MRSLLASLVVLSIGIMAALPFRKSSYHEFHAPPLERSQLASLDSPLEEIDGQAAGSPPLDLSDLPLGQFDSRENKPSQGGEVSFPELPQARRPFAEGLVHPEPIVPQTDALTAGNELDLARRTKEWNLELPLKYVQPQTGLQVEQIAQSPIPTPTSATFSLREENIAATETVAPMDEDSLPSGMLVQPTGSRNANDQQTVATANPPIESQAPRKRYFVYEPDAG